MEDVRFLLQPSVMEHYPRIYKNAEGVAMFKTKLKTFLFKKYFY